MKTGRSFPTGMALLAAVCLLAACAGSGPTRVESDLGIKGAPDWVNEGTAILKTRDGRLFHGVGSAPPMGDRSLQTSTADDRARAEVARVLSSYMNVASQDYTAASVSGDQALPAASVSRQIEAISRVNLAGSRIIGRWRDEKTDIIYALAELDLDQVKDILGRVDDMNAGLREHIREQGDNIFDGMAKEKEKE
ncbi:MAG: hypothetical protein IPM20_00430 [Gammaproteobacteria bacterium]|nr:hypothetical protein [Gammaproteobacteria bacterium]